jgi:hypothetical protein
MFNYKTCVTNETKRITNKPLNKKFQLYKHHQQVKSTCHNTWTTNMNYIN